jgi:hypothetical protein
MNAETEMEMESTFRTQARVSSLEVECYSSRSLGRACPLDWAPARVDMLAR